MLQKFLLQIRLIGLWKFVGFWLYFIEAPSGSKAFFTASSRASSPIISID